MLFLGNVSGHDTTFHLASWFDAASQWRQGVTYPRWAQWPNWGFGEPRFIFYPPASWMLGAALGSILPWKMVPGAFVWLVLLFAGWAMWRLAREALPDSQAIAAAILFVVSPYQLVVVYYRGDFAELVAGSLFPLLLLGVFRVVTGEARQMWKNASLLAIVFAAIWLSNAPAAVIATYSTALMLAAGCIVRRSLYPLLPGGSAMALGFGLGAFYILPVAYEQRWIQIAQVVEGSFNLRQNFLFTHSSDPEFALFNWKVSCVALGIMLLASIAGVFSARRRREYPALWGMIVPLALASVFLMLPISLLLWRYLPELRFLQFPWRWLVALDVPYAFFLASAIAPSRRRWVWYGALVVILACAATVMIRDAWWDTGDIPILEAAIRTGHGSEGTEEYTPLGCDRSAIPGFVAEPDSEEIFDQTPSTPLVERFDPDSEQLLPLQGSEVSVEKWFAEEKDLRVETAEPVTLALRLLNYPAWEARIDGVPSPISSQAETGRMLVLVPAGQHRVRIRFGRTRDRAAGAAISALSAVLLLGCMALTGRQTRRSL